MDPADAELRRQEYYETLAESESLHAILNENAGLVLARVKSYPPWPARFSEPGEYAKMAKYRLKRSHVCVYFFGTRNFGWVPKSSIVPFSGDVSALKSTKKYNSQLIHDALDEAKFILDGTDAVGRRFYDRIMERRRDPVDLPCEICNRVDDHYSNLILCDGVDCKREFHMNCLVPPLTAVPPGDWYCPECLKDASKRQRIGVGGQQQQHANDRGLGAAVAAVATRTTLSPDAEAAAAATTAKRNSSSSSNSNSNSSVKRAIKRRLPTVNDALHTTASTSAAATAAQATGAKRSRATGDALSSAESSPTKRLVVPVASPSASPTAASAGAGATAYRKPAAIYVPIAHSTTSSVDDGNNDMNDYDMNDDDDDTESDDLCLLCQHDGELIVCEFPGCTKVFHQFCLGAYPFPKDETVVWQCPRHTCALSGDHERVVVNVATSDSSNKGRNTTASPRKPMLTTLFWKCTQCPLALSPDKFPPLPATSILSRKQRTFVCVNCSPNAPAKVQLGRILERMWAAVATNRQGLPFCGPLLAGMSDVDDNVVELVSSSRASDSEAAGGHIDLFDVLAKIRGLAYDNSSHFLTDMHAIVAHALKRIRGRSAPLAQAAKTVELICQEQATIHQQQLSVMNSKVKRSLLEARKQQQQQQQQLSEQQKDGGPWSWKRNWPVAWRAECGGADRALYPQIAPRSLTEWVVYITSAPLYATADALDDRVAAMQQQTLSSSSATAQRLTITPYSSTLNPTPTPNQPSSMPSPSVPMTSDSERQRPASAGASTNCIRYLAGPPPLPPSQQHPPPPPQQQQQMLQQQLLQQQLLQQQWQQQQQHVHHHQTSIAYAPAAASAPSPLSFPGLSLSDGTDIMLALHTLRTNTGSTNTRSREPTPLQFGNVREGDYDDVDGRDFFLSPSSSEMQMMMEQQSLLLRQALAAQTALQKSWLLSRRSLLDVGPNSSNGSGFSVGDGRLAAELRLANKNLRARLHNKDKLVEQLTTDHTALQRDVAALQHELHESKRRVQTLERERSLMAATGNNITWNNAPPSADAAVNGDMGQSTGDDASSSSQQQQRLVARGRPKRRQGTGRE